MSNKERPRLILRNNRGLFDAVIGFCESVYAGKWAIPQKHLQDILACDRIQMKMFLHKESK